MLGLLVVERLNWYKSIDLKSEINKSRVLLMQLILHLLFYEPLKQIYSIILVCMLHYPNNAFKCWLGLFLVYIRYQSLYWFSQYHWHFEVHQYLYLAAVSNRYNYLSLWLSLLHLHPPHYVKINFQVITLKQIWMACACVSGTFPHSSAPNVYTVIHSTLNAMELGFQTVLNVRIVLLWLLLDLSKVL